MNAQQHRWLRPLLYALLAVFFYVCFRVLGEDLAKMPAVDWPRYGGAIAMCAALSLLNYALRVIRWQAFMSRLGHSRHSLARTSLYYIAGFAFTLSPGKVGELARVRYYQADGVPAGTVTAAFFIERLLDVLAVLAMSLLIFSSVLSGQGYETLLFLTVLLLCSGSAALVWMPWASLGARYPRLQPVTRMLLQAKALLSPGILLWALGLSLLAWVAEGLGLFLLLEPVGYPVSLAVAMGIYAIAVLAGALSFLPGGLGGTEAVMVALLHQQGIGLGEALLVTLLCRLLTLWFAVFLGWWAVWVLRHPQKGVS